MESSEYPSLAEKVSLATQSGPLLIRAGRLHPALSASSKSRFIHNRVDVVSSNTVVYLISDEPVALVTVGFGNTEDASWWQHRLASASAPGARWRVPALVAGTMPAWANMFQGQLAIWLAVGLVWVWKTSRADGKWLIVGCVLGLMSIKPTVAVLLGLWFVLEMRWRTLGVAAGVALLLAGYGMWQVGPVQAFSVWLESLAYYRNSVHNEVGSLRVLGMQSLLSAYGVPVPGLAGWLVIASLSTVVLFYFRGRGRVLREDVLSLVMGLHVLLLFAHPYELILLAPMVASFWLHLRGGKVRWMVLALGLAGLLSVPERIMQSAGLMWIDHWRTLTVAVLWVWLMGVSMSAAKRLRDTAPEVSCEDAVVAMPSTCWFPKRPLSQVTPFRRAGRPLCP